MPLANYNVLKGYVKERKKQAHFQMLIEDDQGLQYRLAVNVSQEAK